MSQVDPKVGIELFPDVMYFRQGDFHPGCGPLFRLVRRYPRFFFCTEVDVNPATGSTYTEREIRLYVESGNWRIV